MIEDTGEALMREYVVSRIEKAEKPVSDTLSRPRMYTFSNRPPVRLSEGNKSNVKGIQLVTQMFMSL